MTKEEELEMDRILGSMSFDIEEENKAANRKIDEFLKKEQTKLDRADYITKELNRLEKKYYAIYPFLPKWRRLSHEMSKLVKSFQFGKY